MKHSVFISKNEEETKKFAKEFASKLTSKEVIVLTGELRFR